MHLSAWIHWYSNLVIVFFLSGILCYWCTVYYGEGDLCETDVDDCADDPCEHDGTCVDQPKGFTCRCLPEYTGNLCSLVIHAVDDNVTSANATYMALEDQQSGGTEFLHVWFYASLSIIFVLLLIIVVLSICLRNNRRKAKMNIESHRPPEQPAAAPAVAAAAAAATRAAENDYFSIKKPSELSKVTTDDDKSENIDDDDDDPTYESIGGATVSQMSPAVQIQSYGSCKDVCDSERGESSAA